MAEDKTPKPGKPKARKSAAGRKLFDGRSEAQVLAKLEYVWAIGGTDAEAAFYADILPCTLSRYLDSHPNIKQRKEALLERPVLLARQAVLEAFDGHLLTKGKGKSKVTYHAPRDPDTALKYLERKRKSEFAPRQENTGAGGAPLQAGQVVHIYIPHNDRDPLPAQPPAKPKET